MLTCAPPYFFHIAHAIIVPGTAFSVPNFRALHIMFERVDVKLTSLSALGKHVLLAERVSSRTHRFDGSSYLAILQDSLLLAFGVHSRTRLTKALRSHEGQDLQKAVATPQLCVV